MRDKKQSKQRTDTRLATIRRQAVARKSSIVLAVANHAAMGTALGLVFALILVSTPFFGVLPLIRMSENPEATMATLVGTAALMFGVGAALTGFILAMEDADRRH
jgi:hypothetical protein